MKLNISIIGAGIIGAIFSLMLYIFKKNINIIIFELFNKISLENSKVLNNAGTGHSGMCENNYIKTNNNIIYIKKNIRINNKFNLTKQLASFIKYLKIFNINNVFSKTAHISYFYLKYNKKKLFNIFKKINFFKKKLKFTNNILNIKKIFPLLLYKKKIKKNFSLTYYKNGFDINYELLSKKILNFLCKKVYLFLNKEILLIKKIKKKYLLKLKNKKIYIDKIFICCGGNSYNLLYNYNKDVLKNYLNFPINGNWLILEKNKYIKKHNIKVYSQTLKKTPPMSIPHLDIRKIINNNKILFGPYAGITFNILVNKKKNILNFLKLKNFIDIIIFSYTNNYLIKYFLKENIKTKLKKIKNLIPFFKLKKINLLYFKKAGKRLQILKKKKIFKINFGTKIFYKNNLAMILGASPGASISVYISYKILNKWKYFFFIFTKNKIKINIFNKILYI